MNVTAELLEVDLSLLAPSVSQAAPPSFNMNTLTKLMLEFKSLYSVWTIDEISPVDKMCMRPVLNLCRPQAVMSLRAIFEDGTLPIEKRLLALTIAGYLQAMNLIYDTLMSTSLDLPTRLNNMTRARNYFVQWKRDCDQKKETKSFICAITWGLIEQGILNAFSTLIKKATSDNLAVCFGSVSTLTVENHFSVIRWKVLHPTAAEFCRALAYSSLIMTLENCSDEDRGYSLQPRPDNEHYFLHDIQFNPLPILIRASTRIEETEKELIDRVIHKAREFKLLQRQPSIREQSLTNADFVLLCPILNCTHQPFRCAGHLENHLQLEHQYTEEDARTAIQTQRISQLREAIANFMEDVPSAQRPIFSIPEVEALDNSDTTIIGLIDSETTGFANPPGGAPIQIAVLWMLLMPDGTLVEPQAEIQHTLVNPSLFISPTIGSGNGNWNRRSVDIHGFHPGDVANAPSLTKVITELYATATEQGARSCKLLAHSASYDRRQIHNWAKILLTPDKIPWLDKIEWIDTQQFFQADGRGSRTLENLFVKDFPEKKDIPAHKANGDVEMLQMILKKRFPENLGEMIRTAQVLGADDTTAPHSGSICNCKQGCSTNRCGCRKNNTPCSSKCACHKHCRCSNTQSEQAETSSQLPPPTASTSSQNSHESGTPSETTTASQ